MISPLELVATVPLKGRDSHIESQGKRPKTALQIETPQLPFEKDSTHLFKIRRPVIPPRPTTALESPSLDGKPNLKTDGYAMKTSDSTWVHTEISTKDRPPTRDAVRNLAAKYEKNLSLISGYKGVKKAQHLQSVNDLLLDELINELRVIHLGQAELLEKNRAMYAETFTILEKDATKSREKIIELNKIVEDAELAKYKAVQESKIRVQQAEQEASKQVNEAKNALQQRQQEYDDSMKRFLEQKMQLEEHVKALHHVFIDFQSDAVYLTLEELKNKLQSANNKISAKEDEVLKLQNAIAKWKQQYQELEDQKKQLEEVMNTLRNQVMDLQGKNAQLERQIEMLRADMGSSSESESEDSARDLINELGPAPPMANQMPEAQNKFEGEDKTKVVVRTKSKKKKKTPASAPFISIHQKINQVGSTISQFIEKSTGRPVVWNEKNVDENEYQLISSDLIKIASIIETKVDQVVSITDCLNSIDGKEANKIILTSQAGSYRFDQYFLAGINAKSGERAWGNVYSEIRKIFQAKYLSDKWNIRASKPLQRFPEFVLTYFFQEDNKIGSALHSCRRLRKLLKGVKNTEVRMFKRFLKEKYSLDELTFFLEIRHGLIGLPVIRQTENPIIKIPYSRCKDLMDRILGGFSPVASLVDDEASKQTHEGEIDYGVFMDIFIKFYADERQKRRSAVKLMIQSRKFSDADTPIYLELFFSIIQALGFNGPIEQVLEFYREASLLSGAQVTLEGILAAMDNMNIHFYSIDMPMEIDNTIEQNEETRQMIMSHWAKFGQWFDGLRMTTPTLDSWARAQLVAQLRKVDQAFQMNLPVAVQYANIRNLFDIFQFVLNLLARGSPTSMKAEQCVKQLTYLEQLNDCLLSFIVSSHTKQMQSFKSNTAK